jgi:hypothetical protein
MNMELCWLRDEGKSADDRGDFDPIPVSVLREEEREIFCKRSFAWKAM